MYKLDIKIPIYDCVCHIVIGDNIEKVINGYVKRKKWDRTTHIEGFRVHGFTVSNSDLKDYYIFYSTESVTVNTVIHEISHLVDFILDEREIEDKGEAKAYLIGYISEEIFNYILKKNLLINKWYKPQVQVTQKVNDEKPT